MADDDAGRLARAWQQVPEEVRELIREGSETVGRELRGVRSPRQFRERIGDPDLVERLSQPLVPVLDRICEVVWRGSVDLSPTTAHALVSASSALGATLSSGFEVAGILGIEAPPAAASAFGAAGTVGIATGLLEVYVTAATITAELRRAGLREPALLRRALLATYVGGHDGDPRTSRLAMAVLRRVATRWLPVAGIPIAVAGANRQLRRARSQAQLIAKNTLSGGPPAS